MHAYNSMNNDEIKKILDSGRFIPKSTREKLEERLSQKNIKNNIIDNPLRENTFKKNVKEIPKKNNKPSNKINKDDFPTLSNEPHKKNVKEITYKKKKFTVKSREEIDDLFNVKEMLPKEENKKWFDTVPLQATKNVPGKKFIDPKLHFGVDTVGSSKRNGTHDIRGDIPNPKVEFPFNNSTIDEDNNIRGFCQ